MASWSVSKKILEQQLSSHRAWLTRPGAKTMKEKNLLYIQDDLRAKSPSAWRNISDSLQSLAIWYATNGVVAISDGEVSGWGEVCRAWLYTHMALKIRITDFRKQRVLGKFSPLKNLELDVNPCALSLACALVLNEETQVEFFEGAVGLMLGDHNAVSASFWKNHSLAPFVLLLSGWKKGFRVATPVVQLSAGCYQRILDSWSDTAGLPDAILGACEFHCRRIAEGEYYYAEFRDPPFDLIPVEILAIYKVRQLQGIDTALVEHPLLHLWSMKGDDAFQETIEDDLLIQIEAELGFSD